MPASCRLSPPAFRLPPSVSALAAAAACFIAASARGQILLDSFEPLTGWSGFASQGAKMEIAQDVGYDGLGMRVDFDFGATGGFVLVRKDFPLPLPANFVFTFQMRAVGAPKNDFEFKIVDPSNRNVWWNRIRDLRFPTDWQELKIRKARIEYAWGPLGGGPPKAVGSIELAISGPAGNKGSVWIDELRFERRDPVTPGAAGTGPIVSASTTMGVHDTRMIFDDNPMTSWRSGTLANDQWLLLDFARQHEYGGLVIDWDPQDYATSYRVEVSDDEQEWTVAYASTNANGGRDYVYLPDGESRYLRLHLEKSSRNQGYAIVALSVKPFEFSASPNQFLEVIARDSPPGMHPRYLNGRQTYWTVIGVNGDEKEALMNDDGMLEVEKGGFSIEPFLYAGGNLIGWRSVESSTELMDGYLPIPTVTWRVERLTLGTTAFAAGEAGKSALYARYRVENHSEAFQHVSLYLAIRPLQVLPPWQSLNMVGGASPIQEISFDGRTVLVNREKAVVSLTPPDRFGAVSFEEGPLTSLLAQDKLPPDSQAVDAQGFASAALNYSMDLAPGVGEDVYLVIPFHSAEHLPELASHGADPVSYVGDRLRETADGWRATLDRVSIALPPGNERIVQTVKSTIAYVLINRAGPRLQPGARTYARSWIRDGALTSAALLEMGFTEEVREFIRWYATYQAPDGRVPCCIDDRGPDAVPEHDSHGELIYNIAEYYRYTRDVGFLQEMWPHVVKAVEYIDFLRQQRMTEEYARQDKRAFFGLLPESISHEGYAAQPVHAYWDDFFALRGLKDAAAMAIVVNDEERAAKFAAIRDDFQKNLYASLDLTMKMHKIDYIPGSVELGDFDASAVAVALMPGGEQQNLPQAALRHTFDRYYEYLRDRRVGKADWVTYTPYELRNVGAMVRLGERERAYEILDYMLASQRPEAWKVWAEIIWRDPEAPRFIGDMPHTWVASTFNRSIRSMIAYEREADRALVLASGLPLAWVTTDPGFSVKRLPTHYGVLSYSLRNGEPGTLALRFSGDLTMPPGKIVLRPPLPAPLQAVTVNGRPLEAFAPDEAIIDEFPADVVLRYAEPPAEAPTQSPPPVLAPESQAPDGGAEEAPPAEEGSAPADADERRGSSESSAWSGQ